jgi:Fe2+ or Zn2+ uptake regulation protein
MEASHMINLKENVHTLQQNGFRITTQRRTVLEVIAQHKGHPTAEEIYYKARQINPRISLATVYRTLTVLRETGLIDQLYLSSDHDRAHFELSSSSEHFHFRCLGCGKVIEFQNRRAVDFVAKDLTQDARIAEVAEVCVCVEGYCQACARSRKQA